MKLSQGLNLFLISSRAARRSEFTIKWYQQYIGRLISYTKDAEIKDVTIEDLRLFFAHLSGSGIKYENSRYRKPIAAGLSSATILGVWQAVRSFFNWLADNEYIEKNVARRLVRPSGSRREPKSVTNENLLAMISSAKKGEMVERDFALMLFMIDSGCRQQGVINLTLENLHVGDGWALIIEKGDKARNVIFSPLTGKAIKRWLKVRPPGTQFVFTTETGTRLSRWGLVQILRRTKKRAGVSGRINAHAWRHAFARLWIEGGGDLATLSDLMGHTNIKTTKDAYLIFMRDELQRQHQQHSPLETLFKGEQNRKNKIGLPKGKQANKKTAKK